ARHRVAHRPHRSRRLARTRPDRLLLRQALVFRAPLPAGLDRRRAGESRGVGVVRPPKQELRRRARAQAGAWARENVRGRSAGEKPSALSFPSSSLETPLSPKLCFAKLPPCAAATASTSRSTRTSSPPPSSSGSPSLPAPP